MSNETYLINKRMDREFHPNTVYIGRPPRYTQDYRRGRHFGNPFSFQPVDDCIIVPDREAAVKAHADWLEGTAWKEVEPERRIWILKRILQGVLWHKGLVCWCSPLLCHGDTYIRLSEEARNNPQEFARKYLPK